MKVKLALLTYAIIACILQVNLSVLPDPIVINSHYNAEFSNMSCPESGNCEVVDCFTHNLGAGIFSSSKNLQDEEIVKALRDSDKVFIGRPFSMYSVETGECTNTMINFSILGLSYNIAILTSPVLVMFLAIFLINKKSSSYD